MRNPMALATDTAEIGFLAQPGVLKPWHVYALKVEGRQAVL